MADGITIVADGMATLVLTDVTVIVEMEKPPCQTADVSTVTDGTATLYGWLILLSLWQMELPLIIDYC